MQQPKVQERPGFIMRGPATDGNEAPPEHAADHQQAPVAMVYVHSTKCKHSVYLLKLAHQLQVPIDQYDISRKPVPAWLTGCPVLVTKDGDAYCGDEAVAWIQHTAEQQQQKEQEQQFEAAGGGGGTNNDNGIEVKGASLNDIWAESERMAQAAAAPTDNKKLNIDDVLSARAPNKKVGK